MWRFLLLWLWGVAAWAAPLDTPFLRLESGMHTAAIARIGVDAAERYVVTASYDKTARVWDLASGALLQVLRPPLGEGHEGKLYAVAISPDGQEVAVGGFTNPSGTGNYPIYIFDRASGRLTRHIANLPEVVNHLAFSRDGRMLAAVMGAGHGVRLYRRSDLHEVARDSQYGGDSYWLDFDHQGRIVTTCYDGYVRLYGPQLKLLAKQPVRGGKHPFAARFSPDGRWIALGFDDTTALQIVSGQDLKSRNLADTGPIDNGDLSKVAWALDGQTLYAGGRYFHDGAVPLWTGPRAGAGQGGWTAVSGNALMDLQALSGARLLYGAGDPAWGILDSQGHKLLDKQAGMQDLRGVNLRLDRTASHIGFHPYLQSDQPLRFDAAVGQWRTDDAGLRLNKTMAGRFQISDWQNTYAPKFNAKVLILKPYEMSRSLSIADDEQHFVLGTSWFLRYFDQQGTEVWQQATPGETWAVNLSADNRFVVAAFGDGTIRWYRTSDGAEQLAFFAHADGQRWVLWTPSGYYDSAPGGESLMGWHVNRGDTSAADFFPAARFRERLYRPDIVHKVLQIADENSAVQQANLDSGRRTQVDNVTQVLPPAVDLLSSANLQSDATSLSVQYQVRRGNDSPRGLARQNSDGNVQLLIRSDVPVNGLRVRINGQAVSVERGLARQQGDDGQLRIPLSAENNTVQIFAENQYGVSLPVTVQVTRTARPAQGNDNFQIRPKLYIVAVGVAQYQHPDVPQLGLSAKDARDFASLMQTQNRLYREVEIKLLTDAEATRDSVLDALEWLQRQVTQHDVGMLFLSGHGLNDANAGYYYLPVNADPDKLKRSGVAMSDIRSTLSSLAGKAVFFIDTCHSGNVLGGNQRKAVNNDLTGVINELSSAENGVVVFSSSTGKQYSLENPSWGNGAFTKAVLEGLRGGADYQQSGRVTFKMLDLFVSERVKQLTDGKQSPVTQAPGGVPDFPIAAH